MMYVNMKRKIASSNLRLPVFINGFEIIVEQNDEPSTDGIKWYTGKVVIRENLGKDMVAYATYNTTKDIATFVCWKYIFETYEVLSFDVRMLGCAVN